MLYWLGKYLQAARAAGAGEVVRLHKNYIAIGNTINGVRLVTIAVAELAAAWFAATLYGLVARLGHAIASNELVMIMLCAF